MAAELRGVPAAVVGAVLPTVVVLALALALGHVALSVSPGDGGGEWLEESFTTVRKPASDGAGSGRERTTPRGGIFEGWTVGSAADTTDPSAGAVEDRAAAPPGGSEAGMEEGRGGNAPPR